MCGIGVILSCYL